MSDLEWYLDVGGKQSGPHTAKEIVELVRSGKIPPTSHVTAARMSGDWVAARDLVDAYNELYAKNTVPTPIDGAAPFTSSARPAGAADPNFNPPPRPTEQLEASKIIYLNRDAASEKTPDPTEALFQAIQAVREKANQKTQATAASAPAKAGASDAKDSWGQVQRGGKSRVPPQALLIATLAIIFGITIYGLTRLLGKKAETAPAVVEKKVHSPSAPPAPPSQNGMNAGNKLLNEGDGGATAPHPTFRSNVPHQGGPHGGVTSGGGRLDPGGGARYRDERDDEAERQRQQQPMRGHTEEEEDGEIDQNEDGTDARQNPIPVDPSHVNPDRIIPEPGMMPGMPNNNGPAGESPYDRVPPQE